MNTICERIEGKLYLCKSAFENYIDLGNPYDSLQKVFKIGHIVKYCPFCGADIRKPEPENYHIMGQAIETIPIGSVFEVDRATGKARNVRSGGS